MPGPFFRHEFDASHMSWWYVTNSNGMPLVVTSAGLAVESTYQAGLASRPGSYWRETGQ